MKNVNFIKIIPPHIQYEIRRWFWFSTLLFACTLIIIIIFTACELYNLYTLKQKICLIREKTNSHNELTKKNHDLIQKHEDLQKKAAKINLYKNSPKNPHTHLDAIINGCKNDIKLEQSRFNKNNLDLVILCSQPEKATSFIQELLATEKFFSLMLVSLQKDEKEKMLRCTIKGEIKR